MAQHRRNLAQALDWPVSGLFGICSRSPALALSSRPRRTTSLKRRCAAPLACALLLSFIASLPGPAATPQSAVDRVAPLATVVAAAKLPYEQFVLPNGLRVVVSTDRKAPIVTVSVWYHVGSKDEPVGKTGFAHLFEHLMVSGSGSQNLPGNAAAEALERAGATIHNASTWFDRTNYFETVPTQALPLALFVESDRMGYLLGSIDQATLDRQRGVVQNEKRQGDGAPYGLVRYAQYQALFPPGHPYHHTVIGSMQDLNSASLEDVRAWFRGHYGPNNAVLVLAGDIDVATARPLIEKYFGDIPRGAQPAPTLATVPKLDASVAEAIHDNQVTSARVYRMWATPAITDRDNVLLDVAARILGGLSSARLDTTLVRSEKLAVHARARLEALEQVGSLVISIDVRSGVEPTIAAKGLDAVIYDFLEQGPTADEVRRAATQAVSDQLFELDKVGGHGTQRGERGKIWWLGEGALYANDPGLYVKQLSLYARATPEAVRAVAKKWLARPSYRLTVLPGQRTSDEEAKGELASPAAAKPASTNTTSEASVTVPVTTAAGLTRNPPSAGEPSALDYPKIERASLLNGLRLVYARRAGLPITRVAFSLDAGRAADGHAPGTEALMLSLLDRGTETRDATAFGDDEERLGARISVSASMDRAEIDFAGLSANMVPSMNLVVDFLVHPTFAAIEQLRSQQLADIAAERASPTSIAWRILPSIIYGQDHPYGGSASGLGDEAAVAKLTRADLQAFKDQWLRPEKGTIFVVSDLPFATLKPLLARRFGQWTVGTSAAGEKHIDLPIPSPKPVVLLVDRPGSAQSVITAAEVSQAHGTDDLLALDTANEVFGGDSPLSRLNSDIRQTHGWSYYVRSGIERYIGRVPFWIAAPVQADKTGAALVAMRGDLEAFLTAAPITPGERDLVVEHGIRALPATLASSEALIEAMEENDTFRRPDDYYARVASQFRALTIDELNAAARSAIDPNRLVWVIVGDAARVRPQLAAVGIAAEEVGVSGTP